jgi:malate synthase
MQAQAITLHEVPHQPLPQNSAAVLSPAAERFLVGLHRAFHRERSALLNLRQEHAEWLKSGGRLSFLHDTRTIRSAEWSVAPAPPDLRVRHVEITGPAEAKMMINALASGADVFMVDFEDSLSPTWENILAGHTNLIAAVRGRLEFTSPEGKHYVQGAKGATLVVRPRGWHLLETHFEVDGRPMPAALFDFGLAFFHNAQELLNRGSGPYYYLPKLESAREARLWNKIFVFAQDALGIPRGTIRATVLIETITAAFEMDEILFELREHSSGLNAGRWDYLFSVIKKFSHKDEAFPDRALLTMDLPFLRSYCELLVQTCHRRGAHAIGGMSAFVPSRKDAEVNRVALEKVRADKKREIAIGFDGSWVAHPDLVAPVKALFLESLEGHADQKARSPANTILPADLLPGQLPGGITERGVRANIEVAILYLDRWLSGHGAVAIHNLMEDAATAEIARAQLWQWVRLRIRTSDGFAVNETSFRALLAEELSRLKISAPRAEELRLLLDYLVTHHAFVEFLTKPASEYLRSEIVPQPAFN